MPIVLLPEILLVVSTAVVIIGYHTHLYIQIRRKPLTTSVGITNHALNLLGTKTEGVWLFGPVWMLIGSLVITAVLYRLDREA